jgi:hypothetical protein
MAYRITGLEPEQFSCLYGTDTVTLQERGVLRMPVTAQPGFPCRIKLRDADPGSTVLLLNHISHDVSNAYRASHAIFVIEGANEAAEFVDCVPPVFSRRALSLRGFDEQGMMVDALLASPGEADMGIRSLFRSPQIAYIHAHNAVRGCFSARVERT